MTSISPHHHRHPPHDRGRALLRGARRLPDPRSRRQRDRCRRRGGHRARRAADRPRQLRRRRADHDLPRGEARGRQHRRARHLAQGRVARLLPQASTAARCRRASCAPSCRPRPTAWITALERYGTMSFGDVARAAIRLAREGFAMHALMAEYIRDHERSVSALAGERSRVPARRASRRRPGELFVQADLARHAAVHGRRGSGASRQGPRGRAARPRATRSTAATSRRRSRATTRRTAAGSREDDLAELRRALRAAGARAIPRHRRLRLRAVVAGAGAAAGAEHPRRTSTCEAMGHNSPDYIHIADRGAEARVRRPPPLLRRSAVREGADRRADVARNTPPSAAS